MVKGAAGRAARLLGGSGPNVDGFRPSLRARLWSFISGENDVEGGRHLPTLLDLLDWLAVVELDERPFALDELRQRIAFVLGIDVAWISPREIMAGRVANPDAVSLLLKSKFMHEGGMNGGLVRDPVSEDAFILTPRDFRSEEALKPPMHELMHLALGDLIPVPEPATFPDEARRKLRRGSRPGGEEQVVWEPDARAFDAPLLFDYEAGEQRAETLAEYALLASLYGGEALRDLDDHFWS